MEPPAWVGVPVVQDGAPLTPEAARLSLSGFTVAPPAPFCLSHGHRSQHLSLHTNPARAKTDSARIPTPPPAQTNLSVMPLTSWHAHFGAGLPSQTLLHARQRCRSRSLRMPGPGDTARAAGSHPADKACPLGGQGQLRGMWHLAENCRKSAVPGTFMKGGGINRA